LGIDEPVGLWIGGARRVLGAVSWEASAGPGEAGAEWLAWDWLVFTLRTVTVGGEECVTFPAALYFRAGLPRPRARLWEGPAARLFTGV